MPKMATKAADNVFYKARIAASSWNDRLGSREGASEVTGIDRTRLANIELGTINPHPEEVLMLSDTYNAPELQNHFCSHLCPLGIGTISPIELEELKRVTLQLISAMKLLPEVKDGIIDIAADGVYMSELTTQDQAKYIGWQGAFYNLAKLVATGGLVWFAGWLYEGFSADGASSYDASVGSWTVVLLILCGTLVALGLYHLRALPSGGSASEGRSLRDGLSGLKEVVGAFFQKKHIWYYLGFIILYRLGEGFVMKIVPLFLKADTASGGLGLTNQQIGLYYGTFGAGAFLIGSLLAGYYIARRGLRRTLFTLCCIFNLPFGVYALLAWFQPQSMWLVGGGIVVEYFGYGFGFVGLTLFMMQQVAPGKHQMAHYAFASGIMNLSVMLAGAVSGYLSDALGYGMFFLAVMLATVPAFLVTWFVPFTYDDKPNDK